MALLHTLDKAYTSADHAKWTVLICLDFSAALASIDHCTLLNRLNKSFGVSGCSLAWIESYLSKRYQCVRAGQASSPPALCHTGMPQGSVFGHLLFSCYISISSLASAFGINNVQTTLKKLPVVVLKLWNGVWLCVVLLYSDNLPGSVENRLYEKRVKRAAVENESDVYEEEEETEDEAQDTQTGCELLIVATVDKLI